MPLVCGGGHRRVMTDDNNRVHLAGRVSADPETRVLPSGDEVVSFRLIVRRSAAARRRSKQLVDTIECSAWTSTMRRTVSRLQAGAEVEVTGELRRRFTRGAVSFVSVDVGACRKVSAPTVASGA